MIDPAMIQIALEIARALNKYGPIVARELALLFQKDAPTLADWEKVFEPAKKSYEDYVKPLTASPGSTTVTVTTEPPAPPVAPVTPP